MVYCVNGPTSKVVSSVTKPGGQPALDVRIVGKYSSPLISCIPSSFNLPQLLASSNQDHRRVEVI
ncbi:hypothetical protein M404DRAFT_239810 [Pisolithus tinctorius Marx 270]|uniref:Uncharacterized protein n=1 Tax=Pisolithus tinctorius Marx 270 TaxID=870435 RepID=A0A0C3IHU8_PISTI|nr:hypothetical protein M404DRAFT_239810 [Pisolithus tinctorius Marx 270]